jgi:hypothetical protein
VVISLHHARQRYERRHISLLSCGCNRNSLRASKVASAGEGDWGRLTLPNFSHSEPTARVVRTG